MHLAGYRLYILAVGTGVVALCLTCTGLAFVLQPLTGDLTRLGGYAESEFGWNGYMMRYEPPLVAAGALSRAYDVVVVGDSFSLPVELTPDSPPDDRNHWTDYFAAMTGSAVGAFNRDHVSLETFLASKSFRNTPPKLLVVEYAERTLQWAPVHGKPQCVTLGPANTSSLKIRPKTEQPVRYARDHSHAISTERIDEAVDFVTKNLARWTVGVNTTPVSRYALSRGGLFTSNDDTKLLVLDDDLIKGTLSEDYLRSLACYFTQLQSRIESNHQTKFVLMIAPDRTTAYGDFLPTLHLPNLTEHLAQIQGLSILRLDKVMKALILSGTKDVYYPSDTHWGPAGMAAAAEALIRFIVPSPKITHNP